MPTRRIQRHSIPRLCTSLCAISLLFSIFGFFLFFFFFSLQQDTEFGLHESKLLTCTLDFLFEFSLEQIGLLGVGKEYNVVLPCVEVGTQLLDLFLQLLFLTSH